MTAVENKPLSPVAHLSTADVEAIGRQLETIRQSVLDDRGARDAAYIRRVIDVQRKLEMGGRALLIGSRYKSAWVLGTACLAVAKVLDNMEIGHNVLHGQWDWMRDPKIHSTTWEWDHATPAKAWQKTHNYEHHTFTNIRGKDRDLGYTVLRITPEQEWKPIALIQPLTNLGLSLIFEWGIALYDLEWDRRLAGDMPEEEAKAQMAAFRKKAIRQFSKDFVLFPALSAVQGPRGILATAAANLV